MILLTGGTGTVGRELVRLLQDSGRPHRVLTRSSENAFPLEAAGSQAMVGNVENPTDAVAAVAGCHTVISAMTGFGPSSGSSPSAVDRDGNLNLIRAAQDAGVKQFVLFSVRDAGPSHPLELNRMKFCAEQALRDSDMGWTILRPTIILETFTSIMQDSLNRSGMMVVFGRGDRPINFVCAAYVAQAALAAAHSRDLQNSSLLVNHHGSGRVVHIPLPVLRAMAFLATTVAPEWGGILHVATLMCTSDMTSEASITQESLSLIPTKTIRETLAESHQTPH